jgi:predicted nucleotidyltransferase component of viral defense system
VRVYSFDTLIAKKLKTFYERAEGKDIYDLYYGLKQTNDKRQLIRALKTVLKAEQIAYDDFVQGFEEQIRDADSIRRVHASTNPYVPRKLRINWQKAAQYIDRIILPKL